MLRMKFSVKDGVVSWRVGNRDKEVFWFLADGKRFARSVMFVTCMMMVWIVGLGPVQRIRELQNALCHDGSKFPAGIPHAFSCETLHRDVEILSYLWLAATVAIPFILFRRRSQVLSQGASNTGPNA
jgi:hypothetical protein